MSESPLRTRSKHTSNGPSMEASSDENSDSFFSNSFARSAKCFRSVSFILERRQWLRGVSAVQTYSRICALIARDRFASDESKAFQAASRSCRRQVSARTSRAGQFARTASDRPGGGTYSRRPYVRSLVWTLLNNVDTSCFSVTHCLLVVCLYF